MSAPSSSSSSSAGLGGALAVNTTPKSVGNVGGVGGLERTSSDPVAPPSPSKSPIGAGNVGKGGASQAAAAASGAGNAFGSGGALGGLGGFGSGGAGGLGGLGGLTPRSAAAAAASAAESKGVSKGLNSSAAVFSATAAKGSESKGGVSAAANAPIFKPSGGSGSAGALFRSVSAGMTGSRLKLSVRVDQPVENVSTRTTAYIRGMGPVEKSHNPVWQWQRSSLTVSCMNTNCPYNKPVATIECMCFTTTFRFCCGQCLKDSWRYMRENAIAKGREAVPKRQHVRNEGKENEQTEPESDIDVDDRILSGDAVTWPTSKWGDGMTFTPVSNSRSYTPGNDDVGRLLQLKVEVPAQGLKEMIETEMVIAMPSPPPDRRVLVNPMPLPGNVLGNERIRVVTYNLLASIYATQTQYPYCPSWALSWNFRKGQILRELAGYGADVLCLQEVQADHFESFLYPQLSALGYEGLYKQKTREALGPRGRIDGCALFFKLSKFELKEKYVIEFNEAALTMAQQGGFKGISAEEAKNPQMRGASKSHGVQRLLKDNVAQIAVLELRDPYGQYAAFMEHPPRICVSNVHIFWDPQFADVKLWQTHILIKELQKFTQARGLPLVLGGDFNSEPKSSVHDLLAQASVRANHPDLAKDVVGILPNPAKLTHSLPMQSAYHTVRRGQEPPFTNYTGHYVGTLDYIWYTANSLMPVAVLDTYSKGEMEGILVNNLALPAPQFPSDHLSLCCDFALLAQ